MDALSPQGLPSSPPAPVEFLTPRSKVAKMLADIDDAPTPSPTKPASSNAPALEAASSKTTGADGQPSSKSNGPFQVDTRDSDDDSDDAVRRPLGRAAGRMLGLRRSPSPPDDDDDDDGDLYTVTPTKQPVRSSRLPSSPSGSEKSGGLFVSPYKSADVDLASGDELPSDVFGSKDRLAQLVAQKRAERLAKEAEEKSRKEAAAAAQPSSDLPDDAFESNDTPLDPDVERIMSDATRPARKASKKALLEMERETQRLARQQALAHQMKTKKKFTTEDLFARFNFRRSAAAPETIEERPSGGDTTASSAPNSDGVEETTRDPVSTPPSSPPTPLDRQKAMVEQGALSKLVPVREDSLTSLAELPDIAEFLKPLRASPKRLEISEPDKEVAKGLKLARLGKKAAIPRFKSDDDDDDLEIIQALPPHLRAFEKAMAFPQAGKPTESKAMHNLKHLSNLHANDSATNTKGGRPSINPQRLEAQLRKRAKEQARQQQLERIEELRAKGIELQTTEEREKEAEEFETLLEKARQQAVELRKAEKEAAKGANEDGVNVSEDEDEDEDYVESGSEVEDAGDNDEERDPNELIDQAVAESDEEHEETEDSDQEMAEANEDEEEETEAMHSPEMPAKGADQNGNTTRKSRKSRVILDDEDDDKLEGVLEREEANAAADVEVDVEDPFAAFNFGPPPSSLLSPTQAFNATMKTPTQATQEASADMLKHINLPSTSPAPTFANSDIDSYVLEEVQPTFVGGSQVSEAQHINIARETPVPQTPAQVGLNRDHSALAETPGWEPTQDGGLPSPWTVHRQFGAEGTLDSLTDRETQSTVQLRVSESPVPSPTAPHRGRLVRRQIQLVDSDEDETSASEKREKNAFREMARRRREALTAAEKTEAVNEMRGMMDEQAEESEDEYAGIGGDDYVAPETEQDREMIDSSHVEVDERALAAHFAAREREREEAETSKLYKDLTTGVLRRKMGADAFDLGEDDDETAARRRQMRQREEARKRRALLKDENIATLAEGKQSKGKDAFLKAIADDDEEEDIINLSDDEDGTPAAMQDESQQSQQVPLQETSGNKRPFVGDEETSDDRPPAKQRRTDTLAFTRPTSLLQVKESVSFLLDEPHMAAISGPTALEGASDSDGEEYLSTDEAQLDDDDGDDEIAIEAARQNDGGFAPNPAAMESKMMPPPRLPASQRRTASRAAMVDRLSLKRASSCSASSDSALGRTAWAAGPHTGGFKAPSLLRRATTNSTATGANDRGVTTSNGPSMSRENSGGVKMGGSKKSSLAYQARAEERKAIVEASARRREENTRRIAEMRRNSSALGRGLTGRFE